MEETRNVRSDRSYEGRKESKIEEGETKGRKEGVKAGRKKELTKR